MVGCSVAWEAVVTEWGERIEAARAVAARDPVASRALGPALACASALEAELGALGGPPEVAVVLGSGLAGFERRLQDPQAYPYGRIGLPEPGVVGHRGELVLGTLRGRRVAVLSGRAHYYEGHDMPVVTAAVRALAVLGVRHLLLSNAAGAVNPSYRPGDLMVLRDHINFMGCNPLRGPNLEALGPRFPDMTVAYDADLRQSFRSAAERLSLRLHEGVYVAVSGPSYETPSEIRAFGVLGADAVGMSTVPEVIAARHAGMRVAAVSCITNMGAGLSGGLLDHDEVKAVGAAVGHNLSSLFEEVIADLPA